VLRLDAGQHFSEDISGHFVSRAVDEFDMTFFDYIVNEVVLNVDVLVARVIVVVLSENNG
jgi:hypothetical protein